MLGKLDVVLDSHTRDLERLKDKEKDRDMHINRLWGAVSTLFISFIIYIFKRLFDK